MTTRRRASVTRRRVRPARRAAAGLAAVAAVVPLLALPGAAAAAPAAGSAVGLTPVGRVATALDDACDPTVTKYINQRPPALLQLGADEANTIATGKGIVVAVVDSGVDARNLHLQGGAVLPGKDVSGAGTPNGQTDTSGHGTAVAGEIAARRAPGSGIVGLAPQATILPIRVYTTEPDDSGDSGDSGASAATPGQFPPTVAGITLGIITAANAGARIINVSMSTPTDDPTMAAAVRYATAKGALVVASAGNRQRSEDKSNSPRYPGAYPESLAVAAVDGTGTVTDDSIHGSYVDVAAPGTDILTSYFAAGDCQLSSDYASTSYATAYVSAAAALIAQAHPDETPAQWRYRLEATALRIRPDTRDDNAGWGVIQPYEALTFVSDGTAPGPQDPTVTAPPTPEAVQQQIDPAVRRTVDHTARDQTLWLTLGGVVAVLVLALVALLRRDRKRPSATPRTPAGVR